MKITVNQLRKIIKEEVRKTLREATRDPRNLEMDLEGMAVSDALDLQILARYGAMDATIKKVPAPRGTFGMGPDGEEEELKATYILEYGDEEMEFTYPKDITDYFASEGWEFSY